jgi:PAS domain-containing protein
MGTNDEPTMLLAIEDITGRKDADTDLRESEERYRTLFDLGPIGVYSCDASGVIRDFNRRAVELWGRAPQPGDSDERWCGSFKIHRPDGVFLPHDQCPMAEVVSGKIPEARDMEVQIERPDGSWVTVIVNIRPLKNEQGESSERSIALWTSLNASKRRKHGRVWQRSPNPPMTP